MIKECNFKRKDKRIKFNDNGITDLSGDNFPEEEYMSCVLTNSSYDECIGENNCILYQIYNKLDELHISYSEDNKWNWSNNDSLKKIKQSKSGEDFDLKPRKSILDKSLEKVLVKKKPGDWTMSIKSKKGKKK